MSTQTGSINVQAENIFPIIKRFLYSDQDIFLRELIANATDATQKLQKLASIGEFNGDLGNINIEVSIDKDNKQIKIQDRGIGMTADEVQKYINQVAFSGATDFLEKYKDLEEGKNIIGHFGLGFYSAFMVAEKVEIHTKSFKDAPAAFWSCKGDPEFELGESEKTDRGTEIILHVSEDALEYLEEDKLGTILRTHCKFLPIPIIFGERDEKITKGEGEEATEETIKVPNQINNTNPTWTKTPSELTDEDYINFYRELYPLAEDPLFWIHLNVDYPFNLTGILYFPKLKKDAYEIQKNKIQLYCNQVFVTDNVEHIVPEFLQLMHGVIDSPDIPLNVSRSYLQSDKNVKRITSHISKKVADKLKDLFNNDRKSFEEKWESIGLFVKYGIVSDEKFYDRSKSFALIENIDGTYQNADELLEQVKETQKDKNDKTVLLYAQDTELQHSYIQAATNKGYKVSLFDTVIDNHFIQHLEMKLENVMFKRVDADTPDKLIEKDEEAVSVLSEDEETKLKSLFEEHVKREGVTVELKALSPNDLPVMITRSEWSRRMKEMSRMNGGGMMMFGDMPEQINLVVNTNHALAGKVLSAETPATTINQLQDLALLSQGMLTGEQLTNFINRNVEQL